MRCLLLLLSVSLVIACRSTQAVTEALPVAPQVPAAPSPEGKALELAEVPECRLDGSQAKPIREAFEAIRTHWTREGATALPWQQVAVNEAGGDGTIQIQLVTDAFENQVDKATGCHNGRTGTGRLDERSIAGVCQVAGPAALRCSADAVRALIESEPNGRHPNLALFLLLAHEISHLVHGDPGATYTSALRAISRGATEDAKWRALISSCRESGDSEKLNRETRADKEALELIARLVNATAVADEQADPADIRALMLGSLEASLSGLRQWQAGWFGHRDLPPIETPQGGDDPEALARWAADRWLCMALEPGEGTLLVPQANATHPLGSARLAQLSGRVAHMMLPEGDGSLLGRSELGNAQDLLHKVAIAFALIDEAEAQADALRTRKFCESVRRTRAPDCAQVPTEFPRAERTCPEVEASVTWEPLSVEGEVGTVGAEGDHTRLEVSTVHFARPMSDGSVLLGAHGRLGILREGQLTLFDVPCLPRDAVETPLGALVACDHPLGLVRTSRTAPVAVGRVNAIFQGESDVKNSRLDWIGQVGTRTVALFRSGSGTTQTVDVTSDQWTTAMPWRGQGCDLLVHGMVIGIAAGRLTGTNLGHPSIHRTARFDDTFTRATAFTARASLKPLACGLGPSAPLCLTPDGRLVDPEREPAATVARLELGDLVKTGNLRSAALCTAGANIYALVQTRRPDGNSIVELHEVHEGKGRRLLREEWTEEVALRCTGGEAGEAMVSVSTGISTRLWRFGAAAR
ncbi:hypothetical protein JY651_09795 [Pyxidicoccus parkwayensis]|uniref:Lipoprotein n=1 Tax=Pyxidicoccus parkwayensis TaxID=2813578 RepID=A0ABX7P3Z3_9BACT|nr:hypothetical protein [Pyxidicoccus parkwaysis]QSQ25194.1 hypothetical protein JY651_09795 [Pyxidicoccus parkwaysis]